MDLMSECRLPDNMLQKGVVLCYNIINKIKVFTLRYENDYHFSGTTLKSNCFQHFNRNKLRFLRDSKTIQKMAHNNFLRSRIWLHTNSYNIIMNMSFIPGSNHLRVY